MTWSIIIFIVLAIYLFDQHQKQPYKAIDFNVRMAIENKDKFLENLKKEIKMRNKQLEENAQLEKIKSPDNKNMFKHPKKWIEQYNGYENKLKSNVNTKDLFHYIRELHQLENSVVPNFDRHHTRLNTRHKSDIKKLVEISDDYREWYYYQAKLYDPLNYELWNESSFEDQAEARTIINEINSKLGFNMELKKSNQD